MQTSVIGDSFSSNVEGRAVVNARAYEWQPHGHIYPAFHSEVFDGYQPLIVILGDNNVKVTAAGAHENGIAWPWAAGVDAFLARRCNRWRDHVKVFAAKHAILSGMWVKTRNSDAGPHYSIAASGRMSQTDCRQFICGRDLDNCVSQRHVDSYKKNTQLAVGEHHCEIPCSGSCGQDFCMPGVVDA